jgi:hypothetical protein
MEHTLLWTCLAVSTAGLLFALLSQRSGRAASPAGPDRAVWIVVTALPLVVFQAALPSRAPWADGLGFGRGFLTGGLLTLLAAWIACRAAPNARPLARAAAAAAPYWSAVAAVSLALMQARPQVVDLLVGTAIGGAAVAACLWAAVRSMNEEAGPESPHASLLAAVGFLAALTGAAALAQYRGAGALEDVRLALGVLVLGAAVPMAILLAALPPAALLRPVVSWRVTGALAGLAGRVFGEGERAEAAERGVRYALAAAVLALAAWLLAGRLLAETAFLLSAAVGLGAGLLGWWLVAERDSRDDHAGYRPFLALAVMVGAGMAAFYLMGGYGMGVMALAAWLAAGLASSRSVSHADGRLVAPPVADLARLLPLLAFGTVLVLHRLVSARFSEELYRVNLTDFYALFGFLLGVSLPPLLAALAAPRENASPLAGLARLALAGLLLLGVPLLTVVLWQGRVVLALLAGYALAAAGLRFAGSADSETRKSSPRAAAGATLLALAGALAAAQWTHHALLLGDLTRGEKVRLLAWIVGGIAALVIGSDAAERIKARRRPAPTTEGAGQ